MNHLELNLLGCASARLKGGAEIAFPTRKSFGLLAYLAASIPRGASRNALSSLFWAEQPEDKARASLRRTLHELTSSLDKDVEAFLRLDRDTISLSPDAVTVDVLDFERAYRSKTIADLRLMKALYQGRFLSGFPSESPEFENWHRNEALRLEDLAIAGYTELAKRSLETGNASEALEAVTRLFEIDPLHEDGVRLQLRALSSLGRRAEATRRYKEFAKRLGEELDCEPEEATVSLFEHVKRGEEFLGDTRLAEPEAPSVVVLPLRTSTEDNEINLRANAFSEAITSELSRDRSLFVVAHNTALAYGGRGLTAAEIAGDLGVRFLLQGTFAAVAARLRVSIQLIDGQDGGHVWATRFDRPYSDFLEVQDEVVSEIVATLRGYKGALQQAELRRSRSKSDVELTTYELLMRGMAHKETFLRDDMLAARGYFEQAVARNPNFSMAHGWLAWTWFFDVYMGWVEDPAPSLEQTFASAREAVRLDPALDFAHWALGAAYLAAGDLESSLAAFERALDLNPNNSDALANSAWPLMFAGRFDDAAKNLGHAIRLNPFHPEWYLWGLGMLAFSRGFYAQAVEVLKRLNQPNAQSLAFLAASQSLLGQNEAANETVRSLLGLEPDFTVARITGALAYKDQAIPTRLANQLGALGVD